MTKITLGTKVKCSGYLEKQKIKYVFATRKQFEDSDSYIEHSLILEDEAEEGNIPIDQLVYKFKETEFKGCVIGRRSIPTMYCYDFPDMQTGLGEFTTNYDKVFCEKCDYVDCYIIAYRMNCKRFVPVDKVNFEISTIDAIKR